MTIHQPPALRLDLIDAGPFRDEDACQPGIYFAACVPDARTGGEEFRGGALYESRDGVAFAQVAEIASEAVMGYAETALADVAANFCGAWDEISAVDVYVHHGTLSSAPEIDVLNGANHAVLADEVIAFRTATLLSDGRYRLSGLLRGRRNTEAETAGHAVGDRFVLLDEPHLHFLAKNLRDVDTTRYYVAVAAGQALADVDELATSIVLRGNNARPFGPAHVASTRNGSNDLTVSWLPRTRALVRVFNVIDQRLCCCDEDEYQVDVLDGAEVVRTIAVSGALSALYTAAQQTTDGLTPGDHVALKLYQMSAALGRGRVTVATV